MTLRQLAARRDHHQEPGVPGMVAAGAAAGHLRPARDRIRLPLRQRLHDAANARERRGDFGRADDDAWVEGSILLFGGLVAVMALGLPVAFAFLVLNVVGAIAVPRRRARPGPAQPQRRAVGHQLLADADPVLRADGRSAVPYRRGDEGDRRLRAADPPRAGPARGDRDRRRHGVLGDLGLDHRHHRAARQPDAADHAGARLRPEAWRWARSWASAASTC